jgi:hypothetical protein
VSLGTARGRVRWHPPRAVLDLVEFALTGALDPALALDHLPPEAISGATLVSAAGCRPGAGLRVGVSTPYEPPTDADLVLDTTGRGIEDCVASIWELLGSRGHLPMTPTKREQL